MSFIHLQYLDWFPGRIEHQVSVREVSVPDDSRGSFVTAEPWGGEPLHPEARVAPFEIADGEPVGSQP